MKKVMMTLAAVLAATMLTLGGCEDKKPVTPLTKPVTKPVPATGATVPVVTTAPAA